RGTDPHALNEIRGAVGKTSGIVSIAVRAEEERIGGAAPVTDPLTHRRDGVHVLADGDIDAAQDGTVRAELIELAAAAPTQDGRFMKKLGVVSARCTGRPTKHRKQDYQQPREVHFMPPVE